MIGLSSRVKDYGEGDPPYFWQTEDENYLRLVPISQMHQLLSRERNEVVLLKPLYDSQRGIELLEAFERSKAIWIFRHWREVVSSHLRYYQHDGQQYVQALFDTEESSWMNESVPAKFRQMLESFPREKLDPPSSYALFWAARNSLLLEGELRTLALIVEYKSLVERPIEQLEKIASFVDIPLSANFGRQAHTKSAKGASSVVVCPEIEEVCDTLYMQLQSAARLTGFE